MSEIRTLLERQRSELHAPAGSFERLVRRRDRKRRNQRIAAGVVGIAVFVAAVWVVTTGGSFDGTTQTPVAPRPAETGPTQTAPPRAPASAPDVVSQEVCSDGAGVRLELTYQTGGGGLSKVRFEVHRSPVGHEWRIRLFYLSNDPGDVFFRGTMVASDGGDLVVQHRFRPPKPVQPDGVRGKARDRQTGEFCNVKMSGF
jgi:hypothetical protein